MKAERRGDEARGAKARCVKGCGEERALEGKRSEGRCRQAKRGARREAARGCARIRAETEAQAKRTCDTFCAVPLSNPTLCTGPAATRLPTQCATEQSAGRGTGNRVSTGSSTYTHGLNKRRMEPSPRVSRHHPNTSIKHVTGSEARGGAPISTRCNAHVAARSKRFAPNATPRSASLSSRQVVPRRAGLLSAKCSSFHCRAMPDGCLAGTNCGQWFVATLRHQIAKSD